MDTQGADSRLVTRWLRRGADDARMREVRARHPSFWRALVADARTTAAFRAERFRFRSRADALCQCIRLMVVSDAFLAQACYRLKARLQALGVPLLPRLAHRAAMAIAQVCIGDPVVIDGFTEIGPGALIAPFVTIGLRQGNFEGPVIGKRVSVGTGARILGHIHVGDRAEIGANAVVIADVPAGAVATGVPATVRPARHAD